MIFVPAPGRPMDSVQGRNGFALTAISLLPLVDPSICPKSRKFRAQARLARKATIFFAPFVGEGHPHSS
jgi:hypothetical protein